MSCLLVAGLVLLAQSNPTDATDFLRRNWHLSSEEIATVARGEPVGKLLNRTADGEVAILGVIRLNRSKEDYVAWYRQVENYKHSPLVVEVGLLGNPPEAREADRFTLDADELKALRTCQPGNCSVKLTREEIERLRGLDWSAPDAEARANVLARRLLLDYAQAYWQRGNAALGVYQDEETQVDLAAAFRGLLGSSPYLRDNFSELLHELREYRGAKPGAAGEFLYWSRERYGFGLKPTLNLFHVTIRNPHPSMVVIASKRIRSSHYFDGSLSLVVAVDAPGGQSYLIYVNRSRLDLLRGGGFWGWKRKLFEWRLPGEIKKQLLLIRESVESRRGG